MNPAPVFEAPVVVQAHLAFVAAAVGLSAAVLVLPKGRGAHRTLGRLWVGAMAGAALSGLAIFGDGPWLGFGPLHLLSVFVLVNLVHGVRAARRGRLRAHRATMLGLMGGGLLIAGTFAVIGRGRVLNEALFAGNWGI
jgi:uncharacterized membrane protein